MTNNKMTLCYSSPWKLLSIKGESVEKDNMGFRDDAYSLGLLILEVIFNKTSLQKPLQKFIDSEIETKINKKSYLKIMGNLME